MARQKKTDELEAPTGLPPAPTKGWVDDDGRMWTRRGNLELDPVDGLPMLGDTGMSRRRWNAQYNDILDDPAPADGAPSSPDDA